MVPFKKLPYLTNFELTYNAVHTKCRATIERAFMILKCKFKKLQLIDASDPSRFSLYVMACCILHNYCLKHDTEPAEYLDLDEESSNEKDDYVEDIDDEYDDFFDPEAIQKRDDIVNQLFDI